MAEKAARSLMPRFHYTCSPSVSCLWGFVWCGHFCSVDDVLTEKDRGSIENLKI